MQTLRIPTFPHAIRAEMPLLVRVLTPRLTALALVVATLVAARNASADQLVLDEALCEVELDGTWSSAESECNVSDFELSAGDSHCVRDALSLEPMLENSGTINGLPLAQHVGSFIVNTGTLPPLNLVVGCIPLQPLPVPLAF